MVLLLDLGLRGLDCPVTILASIGMSSSIRNRVMMDSTSGPLNRTMSSSRKDSRTGIAGSP